MSRRSVLPAVLLALIACRTAAPTPESASASAAQVVLTLPITFDAGGRTLPVPMVALTVAGHPTQLILDTGASHHVLTAEFARKAALPLKASAETATDHAGAAMQVWDVGRVAVRLGTTDLDLAEVASIPGPPPFEPLGIGGFLSPQHLHPTAHAVLDFASSQLLLVDGSPDAVAAWAAARWPQFAPVSLPRANADRKLLVEAALEPQAPVVTEFDTGGSGTEFLADYVADAHATTAADTGVGLSGATIEGVTVKDRVLRIGGRAVPVPALLARKDMGSPAFKGLLGMDLLRGTVLVVSPRVQDPVLWLVKR